MIVVFGSARFLLREQAAKLLLNFNPADASTTAIEVAVLNCNTALSLKASVFSAAKFLMHWETRCCL